MHGESNSENGSLVDALNSNIGSFEILTDEVYINLTIIMCASHHSDVNA